MSFTEADLKRMGLVKDADGKYKKAIKKPLTPVKEIVNNGFIFIPYNVPSSKNSKQIHWIFKAMKGKVSAFMNTVKGRKPVTPVIRESDLCLTYRKVTKNYWISYADIFKELIAGKEPPYIVEFMFIRPTKARWDFHNIIQLPCDLMQEHGWLEDDDITNLLPVPPLPPKASHRVEKGKEGVEIRVL